MNLVYRSYNAVTYYATEAATAVKSTVAKTKDLIARNPRLFLAIGALAVAALAYSYSNTPSTPSLLFKNLNQFPDLKESQQTVLGLHAETKALLKEKLDILEEAVRNPQTDRYKSDPLKFMQELNDHVATVRKAMAQMQALVSAKLQNVTTPFKTK